MVSLQATFTFLPKWKHSIRLDFSLLASPLWHQRGDRFLVLPNPRPCLLGPLLFSIDRLAQNSRSSGPGMSLYSEMCALIKESNPQARQLQMPPAGSLLQWQDTEHVGWAHSPGLHTALGFCKVTRNWVTGWQSVAGDMSHMDLSPWMMYPLPGFTPPWKRME